MSQLAKLHSRGEYGLKAPLVEVEVHLLNGLPNFSIVGLPETAVKESKDRVISALINTRFEVHKKRTTVSLSPANLPKKGGRFDLPIAIGLLLASKQIKAKLPLEKLEFYGELGLDGTLRFTSGLLPAVMSAIKHNKRVVVPVGNLKELSLLDHHHLIACQNLLEVCTILSGQTEPESNYQSLDLIKKIHYPKDFCQIRGQQQAKRALEVAASGGHNVLFIGSPGAGKTMLAERLPSILPPLSRQEALEKLSIFSIAAQPVGSQNMLTRTFRTPHHSASAVALVGGGSNPKPGEISLAHRGVLFLDELPEFSRHSLEVLRQPLENGVIHLSRASGRISYPANFQLIAAMNPCPCGYWGDKKHSCHCTQEQIYRYRHKISGPLLDRIDIVLSVPALETKELLAPKNDQEQTSSQIQQRVLKASQTQQDRQQKSNSNLSNEELERHVILSNDSKQLLEQAIDKLGLSARSYYRVLKVARTIADLADNTQINVAYLSEAISYRRYEI